jgi:CRP/FNR family transcriptional regulator
MFIKEADLFKEMSQDFMNELAKIMIEEPYGKGTSLFKEGDPANAFYVLEEGRVRLSVGTQGHIVYISSNPGDALGWSSLVELETYTASAECVSQCKLIKIEREKLNKIFEKHLADGVLFYKRLAGLIGQRLINSYNSLLSSQRVEDQPSYG